MNRYNIHQSKNGDSWAYSDNVSFENIREVCACYKIDYATLTKLPLPNKYFALGIGNESYTYHIEIVEEDKIEEKKYSMKEIFKAAGYTELMDNHYIINDNKVWEKDYENKSLETVMEIIKTNIKKDIINNIHLL